MQKKEKALRILLTNILVLSVLSWLPFAAFAYHEPLVAAEAVIVNDPTTPRAYYGTLAGNPHVYHFESAEPFTLHLRLLVPDMADSPSRDGLPEQSERTHDIIAALVEAGNIGEPLATLDGSTSAWEPSEEVFSGISYVERPFFDGELEAGIYEVRVWSSNNDRAYGLLIGERDDIPYPTPLSIFLSLVIIGLIVASIIWSVRKGSREDEGAPSTTRAPLTPFPPLFAPLFEHNEQPSDVPKPPQQKETIPLSAKTELPPTLGALHDAENL